MVTRPRFDSAQLRYSFSDALILVSQKEAPKSTGAVDPLDPQEHGALRIPGVCVDLPLQKRVLHRGGYTSTSSNPPPWHPPGRWHHGKSPARLLKPELAALELEGRAIESYISAYSFGSTLSYMCVIVCVIIYQSHSFRGLPAATRKRVGTVWGSCRCHTFV